VRVNTKAFFRALIIFSAFATLLLLGLDPKVGVIAVLAIAAIDALSFLLPLGMRIGLDKTDRESSDSR
jgi:hypothetical protein